MKLNFAYRNKIHHFEDVNVFEKKYIWWLMAIIFVHEDKMLMHKWRSFARGGPNEAFFCQCIPTGQRIAWVTRVVRDCTRKKEQQFGTPHIASALNIAISCSLGSRPINQPKTAVPGHYVSTMIRSFFFFFFHASKSIIWIKFNINFNRPKIFSQNYS